MVIGESQQKRESLGSDSLLHVGFSNLLEKQICLLAKFGCDLRTTNGDGGSFR